jgi:SAM-dependent methyltransferase
MIAIAEGKRAAAPVPGLTFTVAPADARPPAAAAAPFDAVLAFNVLHLMRDLPGALRAVRAAVATGGRFVSKTPCLGEMSPLVSRGMLPLMRLFRLAPPVAILDAAALVRAIGAAGFAVEAVERHGTRGRDARPFIVARAI